MALPIASGAGFGHLLLDVDDRALEGLPVVTLGLADDFLDGAGRGDRDGCLAEHEPRAKDSGVSGLHPAEVAVRQAAASWTDASPVMQALPVLLPNARLSAYPDIPAVHRVLVLSVMPDTGTPHQGTE